MTVTITTPPKLTEASLTTLRNHMAAQLKSTNLTIINAIPLE
jgi:F0F1-type ATP synthase delta subunit